jgi:hypothetical protein
MIVLFQTTDKHQNNYRFYLHRFAENISFDVICTVNKYHSNAIMVL